MMRKIQNDNVVHILEDREDWAIKAALAANRPLLVRGEPGVGKTQLAYAAAVDLNRPIKTLTVDSSTESRDLLWTFDAVQRLAEAQVLSMTIKEREVIEERIRVHRFVKPGPLWWAFDWQSAERQVSGKFEDRDGTNEPHEHPGAVILIDEIDKAESDVPNGLLEAFGMRQFTPQGFDKPIKLEPSTKSPLVIITTNEERSLPDAFMRRCFVIQLTLPEVSPHLSKNDGDQQLDKLFINYVTERGRAHFANLDEELLQQSAELLLADRRDAIRQHWKPLPGLAEFLDFLRAIENLTSAGEDPWTVFKEVQSFVFRKRGDRR